MRGVLTGGNRRITPPGRAVQLKVATGIGILLVISGGVAVANDIDILGFTEELYSGVGGVDERGFDAEAMQAQVQAAVADFFDPLGPDDPLDPEIAASLGGPGSLAEPLDPDGGEGLTDPLSPDAIAQSENPEGTQLVIGNSNPLNLAAVADADTRELANVVLTYAQLSADGAVVEAAGYVPVLDASGKCIIRLADVSGTVIEQQVESFADAATVICSGFSIPVSELASGIWQVTLGYESDTILGASLPLELLVP